MNEEIIAKAGELITQHSRESGYCTIAVIDLEGYPTAPTISVSKSEGINWMTFCTGLHSPKAERIKKCNKASVCFNSMEYNITLVGTIEIITDPDVKNEMWYGGLSNHFSGSDDPEYCVLRFTTERYNLLVDWNEAAGTI